MACFREEIKGFSGRLTRNLTQFCVQKGSYRVRKGGLKNMENPWIYGYGVDRVSMAWGIALMPYVAE